MRAVVVYESIYGNTREIAEAIADGLRAGGPAEVEVMSVESATARGLDGVDMLVAGGPTHMHGMTSSMSRRIAVKAAEDEGLEVEPGAADGPGLRSWLRDQRGDGTRAAAFDTRGDASPTVTGMAARGIAKRLRRRGFETIVEPESFLVEESEGPLAAGEVDRARRWGETLAARIESSTGGDPAAARA
jgi:flavodoxin